MSRAATMPTELATITAVEALAVPEIAETPASTNRWRDVLKVHSAAEMFPMMSLEELRELGEDIKAHGLHHEIQVLSGAVIDGRNRLDAMELVGMALEFRKRINRLTSQIWAGGKVIGHCRHNTPIDIPDPYSFVISQNIHRRHLTTEHRKALATELLKANPARSNRSVAAEVKLDDKTVASVRKECEARSEIPHVETRADSKGRLQPGTKRTTKALRSDPAATSPKTPAEPRIPATRKRDDWANATSVQLSRDFVGTVQTIGKLIGEHKAKADELSQFRREQLLEPIAQALRPLADLRAVAVPADCA